MNNLRKQNLIMQGKTYALLAVLTGYNHYLIAANKCMWKLKKMEYDRQKRLLSTGNTVTKEYKIA